MKITNLTDIDTSNDEVEAPTTLEKHLVNEAYRIALNRDFYMSVTVATYLFALTLASTVNDGEYLALPAIYAILISLSLPLGLILWRWVINAQDAKQASQKMMKEFTSKKDSRLAEVATVVSKEKGKTLLSLRAIMPIILNILLLVLLFSEKTLSLVIILTSIYGGILVIALILSLAIQVRSSKTTPDTNKTVSD